MVTRDRDLYSAAHRFSPSRLTLARELRGMTKTQLAELTSKTPSAITQFEGGQVRPDALTLKSLALALGMRIEFFAADAPSAVIPIDACHFRSLRSAAQWQRRKLLAQASLLCEVLSWLDREVDFPPERVSEVAEPASTLEEIEACAKAVRRKWGLGLGPIPNLTELLENKGVLVMRIDQAIREVDAFSFWHEGRPCVLLVMEKGSPSRTRWDAAHELGHLVMHADVAPGNPEIERDANRFASAFLLPREPFLRECPRRLNLPHFFELKSRWKVSVAALLRRARDLGCLSDASYRRGNIILRKNGPREPREPQMERPRLLTDALKLIADDWPLSRIAAQLSMSSADLLDLVAPDAEDRAALE